MNCEGDLEIEGGEKRGGGDAAGEGLGTCQIAADLIGLKRGFGTLRPRHYERSRPLFTRMDYSEPLDLNIH